MLFIQQFLPTAWRSAPVISRDVPPRLPGSLPANVPVQGLANEPGPLPAHVPARFPVERGNVCRSAPTAGRKASGDGALILALMAANRPVNITELAELMSCCRGEASKRVKAAGKRVKTRRVGRFKYVELRKASQRSGSPGRHADGGASR